MFPGLDIVIRHQITQALASDAPNVVSAVLHWREVTRPENFDPNDESSAAGTATVDKTQEFRAFFHTVDHRMAGFQRFMEVQTGDVILDYMDDLNLASKPDGRIEINGQFYVQKTASTGLLEAWDVRIGSNGTLRTLLLSPAQ